jgi:hypothetical protein
MGVSIRGSETVWSLVHVEVNEEQGRRDAVSMEWRRREPERKQEIEGDKAQFPISQRDFPKAFCPSG